MINKVLEEPCFFHAGFVWPKVCFNPRIETKMSNNKKPAVEEEEDFLTEDPEISSQKIVLLSFLSPEKVLANKDVFFFTEFIRDYNMQWKTSKLESWMAEQVQAMNTKLETIAGSLEKVEQKDAAKEVRDNVMRVDRFVEEFQEHIRKSSKEIKTSTIQEDYESFMFKNQQRLEDEFHKKNDYHTTIRGLKVRGVYSTEAEAQARAKKLQKSDPNFNIFMGSVGKWMAWDPEPTRVTSQEYANEQLNTLMKKYQENEDSRNEYYTAQKQRRIGQAKTRPVEDESASNVSSSNAAGGTYDAMFNEPGDLAIRRKMEREDK
jgi:hypothetical protein